jgi:hemin uptake protein HemP
MKTKPMDNPHPAPTRPSVDPSASTIAGQQAVPHLQSQRLLGAAGEAVIEHDGHLYRLRRTSRGGLVLTK